VIAGAHARVLVLAHPHDVGAAAVARAIAARWGEDSVWGVSPAELGRARRWTHTVSADGAVGGELILASGRRVVAAGVGCVFNRIRSLVPPAFARAPERERDYAAAELQALLISWVAGLGRPVVDAAGGVGPVAAHSRRRWLTRAVAAGIPVARDLAATSTRLVPREPGATPVVVGPWPDAPAAIGQPVEVREEPAGDLWPVLVAGDRVHGPLDERLSAACVELARDSGCALLQLTFGTVAGTPRLVDADPFPPLLDDVSVSAAADLLERLSGAAA
jgi:hypothetical protein